MKQLLVLSGKGGTGKTTFVSAFIKLADAGAYADCDVDAPNLHLLMGQGTPPEETDYFGMPKAVIDSKLCIGCNKCRVFCKFDAIVVQDGYKVDDFACEGCGVCVAVCPVGAVKMQPAVAGKLKLYRKYHKIFSTAQLKMGSGTSGKLVTEVKKAMNTKAQRVDLAILDGSPGIGCPVIASLSGVDFVLIVAEPSISGISDMKRIIQTAKIMQIPLAVAINKYDTNLEKSEEIETFCREEKLPFVGAVPFDNMAVEAINSGNTIVDIDCPSGKAVQTVYENLIKIL
ncbi:MAG: ATP-binding protein [Acidaminococcaceae bacterium]|nr:ATP-binding protein [Acidaminococcaceae bacterium]